jgi:hypothetical protein
MYERRPEGGTRIYEDHRDNLTIDVHSDLVLGRAAEMRSEHSESALLWNVFRTLQRIDPGLWMPRLLRHAFGRVAERSWLDALLESGRAGSMDFHWWARWDVPPERDAWLRDEALSGSLRLDHYASRSIPEKKSEVQRRLQADLPFEEPVEIPLCIETPAWLLGIEAVYKGNLRRVTTYDSQRDAVLRLLDAGTAAARARGKVFMALVVCADPRSLNAETARLVERYRGRPERLVEAMPHRPDVDTLRAAAHALDLLRWRDVGALLLDTKEQERLGAFDVSALDELIKYLGRKDIGFNFFRRLK